MLDFPSVILQIPYIDMAAKKKAKAIELPPKLTSHTSNRVKREEAGKIMADSGFDPLEWAIKIAKGEALHEDHPFLSKLQEWKELWLKNMVEHGKYITPDDLENLMKVAVEDLTESYTPIKIRADQIKDLLQYIYPKLKATEHTGAIQVDHRLKPITREEAKAFKEVFDENY